MCEVKPGDLRDCRISLHFTIMQGCYPLEIIGFIWLALQGSVLASSVVKKFMTELRGVAVGRAQFPGMGE